MTCTPLFRISAVWTRNSASSVHTQDLAGKCVHPASTYGGLAFEMDVYTRGQGRPPGQVSGGLTLQEPGLAGSRVWTRAAARGCPHNLPASLAIARARL